MDGIVLLGSEMGKAVFPGSAARLEAAITKCEVTRTVAEATRTWKEIRPVTHRRNLRGSVRVTRTQMWVDLIRAGVDGRKLDGKPNRILLELWQELKPVQQFSDQRGRGQRQSHESGLCVCKTFCWRGFRTMFELPCTGTIAED